MMVDRVIYINSFIDIYRWHITHTEVDALCCLLQRLCVNCGVSFKDPPPSQNAQKEKTSFRGKKNLPAKESKDILVRNANVRGQQVPDCTSKQTNTEASTQCNKKITNPSTEIIVSRKASSDIGPVSHESNNRP